MNKYKPVIGLEIHVELKTKSKMFCQCEADYFGKKPNSNVCPVCLGLPGALPVPNRKAVDWTTLIGKALDCSINEVSKFDRKHYFYPDLPKGYQISQYDEPIATKGIVEIRNPSTPLRTSPKSEFQNSNDKNRFWTPLRSSSFEGQASQNDKNKTFRITRVHLEEDTGKLLHIGSDTLVDFNRSGVPLVEIVTEPDFDNSDDVKRFLEELQTIIRYLGVSDADMEKGSMRLEPNISIAVIVNPQGSPSEPANPEGSGKLPNYKVEIKNINSFRFVKEAIEYEVDRQIAILEKGETPIQETRGYDEKKRATFSQRSKEEAHDYRYFPEPDIPPMTFAKKFVDSIIVPELPAIRVIRYIREMGLREKDAFVMTRDKKIADYFENVISKLKSQSSKLKLKTQNLNQTIANFIINKKIPANISVNEFVKKALDLLSHKETDEKALDDVINQLIKSNQKAVEDYKKGKENAIMFLVGQVMREMRGKADAKIVKQKLIYELT